MQPLNNEHQMSEFISIQKHLQMTLMLNFFFYKLLIGQLQITMSHIMGDSLTERRPANVKSFFTNIFCRPYFWLVICKVILAFSKTWKIESNLERRVCLSLEFLSNVLGSFQRAFSGHDSVKWFKSKKRVKELESKKESSPFFLHPLNILYI